MSKEKGQGNDIPSYSQRRILLIANKCDGRIPACQRCTNYGRLCPGYEQKLEFVFFKNDPTAQAINLERAVGETSARIRDQEPQDGKGKPDLAKDRAPPSGDPHIFPMLNPDLDQTLSVPQNRMAITTILHNRYVPDIYFPTSSDDRSNGICSSVSNSDSPTLSF